MKKLITNLERFKGRFIIQSLFLTGNSGGREIDNTSGEELTAWVNAVTCLNPYEVHIYSLARETPSVNLHPVSYEKLVEIGNLIKEKSISSFVFN
jgi:hypothetical protein